MSSRITIRKARLADLEALLAFEQSIIEFERPFDPHMVTNHFNYYDLAELLENPDAEVLVAESGQVLVGSGYAKKKKSLHFHEDEFHSFFGFMYVDPEFRGQGINKKIIDELKLWSNNKGLNVVRLTVYADNPSAIKAYQKTGFSGDILGMQLKLD